MAIDESPVKPTTIADTISIGLFFLFSSFFAGINTPFCTKRILTPIKPNVTFSHYFTTCDMHEYTDNHKKTKAINDSIHDFCKLLFEIFNYCISNSF